MSADTASAFAQIIVVFLLAMMLEGAASAPNKRSKRRKHLKEIGLASLATLLVVVYLLAVIEMDGVSGLYGVAAWAVSTTYLALTVLMTFAGIFTRRGH